VSLVSAGPRLTNPPAILRTTSPKLGARGSTEPSSDRGAQVLLADDHCLVLDLIEELIRPAFKVVGTATNGKSLLEAIDQLRPDMVLTDIKMAIMNGLEAGKAIKQRWPEIKLVYLTDDPDPTLAANAFSIGAEGYLLKHCRASELLCALRIVRDGGVYLTHLVAGGDVDLLLRQLGPKPGPRLSPRELEVVALLVRGLPMKQVARRLNITPRTVAFHKYNAMTALGLEGNADLLKYAMQTGLLIQSDGAPL
jgi:DNA-binding NarL/FixJ family response regulator